MLRVAVRQVLRWVTRRRDPLRLLVFNGVPQGLRSHVQRWHRRNLIPNREERLHGWEAIGKRAVMSRGAAIQASTWSDDPLPVFRKRHLPVWAYASAIDDWKAAQTLAYWTWRRLRDGLREERATETPDKEQEAA